LYSELITFFDRCGLSEIADPIIEEASRLNPHNAAVCQLWLRSVQNPSALVSVLKAPSAKWTADFTDRMTATVCDRLAATGDLPAARRILSEALVARGGANRFKLLLAATTIELLHGDPSIAPLLLDRMMRIGASKSRPMVLILWAKVCELARMPDRAFALFQRAIDDYSADWRVFLDMAQFQLHCGCVERAVQAVAEGLKIHSGSGRLWAFRVQLAAFAGVEDQVAALRNAVRAVPKSGEVWCEAARVCLNPLSRYFNLAAARRYLEFAHRFTPQHGDSLIEMLRVEMLEKGINGDFLALRNRFVSSEENYGLAFMVIRGVVERPLTDVFQDAVREVRRDVTENRRIYARAMARSAFVLASIAKEEGRLERAIAEMQPARFAFGLAHIGQWMLDPSLCPSREQRLALVLGASGLGL
jgi:hypothetical protein